MARKLTNEERDAVEALRAALVEALPAEERSNASGIASSLVRLKEDRISESELAELLAKYEEGDGGLAEAVKDAVLVPVEDDEGMYTVRAELLEQTGAVAEDEASVEQPADAEEPKAIAKQEKAAREKNLAKRPKRTQATEAAPAGAGEKDAGSGTENDVEKKPARRRRTRKTSEKTNETGSTAEIAEDEAAEESVPKDAELENAASEQTEGAPKDMRPGRAGRARKRAEHIEAEAESAAKSDVDTDKKSKETAENSEASAPEPQEPVAAADALEEQPKPKRRPRRRTKVMASAPEAGETAETAGDVESRTEAAAADPNQGEAANGGSQAAEKKPARRRRSHSKKKADDADQNASETAAESLANTGAEDEPEPNHDAEEPEAEAAVGSDAGVEAADETPQPDGGAEKKPARRRRRSARRKPSADNAQAAKDGSDGAEDEAESSAPSSETADTSDSGNGLDDAPADSEGEASHGVDEAGTKALKEKKEQKRDPRRIPYIRKGGETEAEIRQKIVQLDPRFWMNGWLLSHPGAYTLYEHEITTMNDALANGTIVGEITRRQLAYQMGGDEKFFEYGNEGFRLLRALGMEDIVRRRPMPKIDLVYHAPRRRKHMRVLVTENLDPYLDVHDIMYEEGRSQILGERIHAVVLGAGSPVLEHNRMSLLLDNLGAETTEVLYWGDIDRAGLQIMVRLNKILQEKYAFHAFTPAYKLMIQKAMERFPDPGDNEPTGQVNIEMEDADILCEGLTEEEAAYAREVIVQCRLIPQEILTRRDL